MSNYTAVDLGNILALTQTWEVIWDLSVDSFVFVASVLVSDTVFFFFFLCRFSSRSLKHPNILQCLGQCSDSIPFLLVMEFCQLVSANVALGHDNSKTEMLC